MAHGREEKGEVREREIVSQKLYIQEKFDQFSFSFSRGRAHGHALAFLPSYSFRVLSGCEEGKGKGGQV